MHAIGIALEVIVALVTMMGIAVIVIYLMATSGGNNPFQ